MKRFALASFVSALPAPALAEGAVATGSLVQMLLALVAVLAAIAVLAWALRRFGPQRLRGGAMKILGAIAVGPRERLVLVEIGETWLVVGVAPGQVRAVHALPRPENAAQLAGEAAAPASFAARLEAMLDARKA